MSDISEFLEFTWYQQIWLIVTSEKRQISDLKKLENNLKKEKDKGEIILKSLQKEEYLKRKYVEWENKSEGIVWPSKKKLRYVQSFEIPRE